MLLTPETIHRLLQDRNCAKVSEATGLSAATINHIANGRITNPTADTLQKLTDYFEAQRHGTITQSN